jgi:hypothetical protein
MGQDATKYHSVNAGRDIAITWRPEPWLVVEVGYTGHIVGFLVSGGHDERDALRVIVAAGQLAPELLRSVRH